MIEYSNWFVIGAFGVMGSLFTLLLWNVIRK